MTHLRTIILGGMDAAEFLQTYWQKQPYLIKQANKHYQSFVAKQDLIDLSYEDNVESRLVLENSGEYPWQVNHGPFCKDDFDALPDSHWSLLLQNTEFHIAAAARFLDQFKFIPNWRIDDLMVSFATKQGSVGPHIDNYDVFLFQAVGKRQWSINLNDYSEDDFIEGLDLRIIKQFEAEQEWILEPGDMLYLPPGIAHHGIALEESITFSIGFRAPSSSELLGQYLEDMVESSAPGYYQDQKLSLRAHCGEISPEEGAGIAALFQSSLPDDESLRDWFGKFVTRLPENFVLETPQKILNKEDFYTKYQSFKRINKSNITRTAFMHVDEGFTLFVNGESYPMAPEYEDFIYSLTEQSCFENPLLKESRPDSSFIRVLCRLYNDGIFYFDA
jgi:50S ribosomal protein L16 3-hydroxylase